jgi:hypothetical protein
MIRNSVYKTDLLPGSAAKTANVFSCLHATWVFKKVSRCARNVLNDNGFSDKEHECHCVGERSITRERCDGESSIRRVWRLDKYGALSNHVTFTSLSNKRIFDC